MDIAAEHKAYEFGDFRIDTDHRMLYHQGREIPMVPKAVEIPHRPYRTPR